MKLTSHIVLKLLGILLLTAAVLKGWQLLTEPVTNDDIWPYRPFLILTVEFEITLGIGLLSGLFKKAIWLVTISCFSLFTFISLYKGLTGAESCGCFGSVHVNPWIILFAIDIPSVMVLAIFRPKKLKLFDWPPIPRFVRTVTLGLVILSITIPVLAFNEPAKVTSSYEVLVPETWVGKKLPILEYIDIAERLDKGIWLILLYHHDCTDCTKIIPKYEQIASDIASHEDFLLIALIEVPPFGLGTVSHNSSCIPGQLMEVKEWLVKTPSVVLLNKGIVQATWEESAPGIDDILFYLVEAENFRTRRPSISLVTDIATPQKEILQ